jgi:hypothetical protein
MDLLYLGLVLLLAMLAQGLIIAALALEKKK